MNFRKFLSLFAVFAILFTSLGALQFPVVDAAIEEGDYFTVTAAGNATSMVAGESLVFTIGSFDTNDSANTIADPDFAWVEIIGASGGEFGPNTGADITAVGSGVTIAGVGSGPDPGANFNGGSSDISGENDNLLWIRLATGDSVNNTITVTAEEDFEVIVSAPGADFNPEGTGANNPAGQDFRIVTMTQSDGSPHHLEAEASVDNPEVGEEFTVTVEQVTANGGLDIAALSDLAMAFGGAGASFVAVNGTELGSSEITLSDVSLVNGVATFVVHCNATGALTIEPSSATLNSDANDVDASVTCSAASDNEIKAYGPPNGQNGVPVTAPVDIFLTKDPDEDGQIFPQTNAGISADGMSFLDNQGGVVSGQWEKFSESFGSNTLYIVTFIPDAPLNGDSQYTAHIGSNLFDSANLDSGIAALTGGPSSSSFSFTTGTSFGEHAGNFQGGEGGQGGHGEGGQNVTDGTLGGEFPPMAFMDYPLPGTADAATNVPCVVIGFDRPMDSTTLTTSNIYIKKLVNDAESSSLPAGPHTVTSLNEENSAVCIGGYTYESNSEYVVTVSRDVEDLNGDPIAGMPVDDNGDVVSGFGFGFTNMGPFKESFFTGSETLNLSASLIGTNLDQYKSGNDYVNVPTGETIVVGFDSPLNPATVNASNVILSRGSTQVAGKVFYHAAENEVEFKPDSVLGPNILHTLTITDSVGGVSSDIVIEFTAASVDFTKPTVAYAEADNFGIVVDFDERMKTSTVENKGNITLKVCSDQAVNTDGVKCIDNSTDPTVVNLLTGSELNYHGGKGLSQLWITGLTLSPGDGWHITFDSTNVKDVAGNAVDSNSNANMWDGIVQDATKFFGGQGILNMTSAGFEDFNMADMGMAPIFVEPGKKMAGASTDYQIGIPLEQQIPSGGLIEITFPNGFDVSGAEPNDLLSNDDFNGSYGDTVSFAGSDPSNKGYTAGGSADDGVSVNSGANRVIIQLSSSTGEGDEGEDYLDLSLTGISNSSQPKPFGTQGYNLQIRTLDTNGNVLEALTSMPFFINAAGTNVLRGVVSSGGSGVNNIDIFLDCPGMGIDDRITENGAFDAADGEYQFTGLPDFSNSLDNECKIFTEKSVEDDGGDTYFGIIDPIPVTIGSGTTTFNFSLTPFDNSAAAELPVGITLAEGTNLNDINNLGSEDSIDVFASHPQGNSSTTLTRSELANHISDPGGNPIDLYLPFAGHWNVGIGPSMSNIGSDVNSKEEVDWIPPADVSVFVSAAQVSGGSTIAQKSFVVETPTALLQGSVVDNSNQAIANASVYLYSPVSNRGIDIVTGKNGLFSLPVVSGTYILGFHKAGLPPSKEVPVFVANDEIYVDGDNTVITDLDGENPLYLTSGASTSGVTIQGRVTDGSNPIPKASVWAYSTDDFSYAETKTDGSGNYTLYISGSSVNVEAHGPDIGYLGSKTVVATESLTGQNFAPDTDNLGSIAGSLTAGVGSSAQGAMVWAHGPNGFNEAKVDADGNYDMSMPFGTYTIQAHIPGVGDLPPIKNVVVDGAETGHDLSSADVQELDVTISDSVSDDTIIDFFSSTGVSNSVVIPAGETSASVTLPEGDFFMDTFIPSVNNDNISFSADGFNSSLNRATIDDDDDNDIDITVPTMRTISGTVDMFVGGENVGGSSAFVSLVNPLGDVLGVEVGSDATWSAKVPDGQSFSAAPSFPGSYGSAVDVEPNGSDVDDVNLSLTQGTRTITGEIDDDEDNAIEGAFIFAEKAGGGFATAVADSDGSYQLPVTPGIWTVKGIGEGYQEGTSIVVDTTNASATAKDFDLVELETSLTAATTKPVTPTSGGTITNANSGTTLVVPPNALGSSSSAGSLTVKETNNVPSSPTATPLNGLAQEITAKDSNNVPITNLSSTVQIEFEKTLAQLTAAGIDDFTEMKTVKNSYLDTSKNNWVSIPTTMRFVDSDDAVIASSVVKAADSLEDAGVAKVTLISDVDHFTTFAPTVASGATPPATPSGLTITGGDTQADLEWTANSEGDMSSYKIWEANVTEGVLTTLSHASCGATCTTTISSLTNGTEYAFQLIAVDSEGNESAGSSAVSVTPAAAAPSGSSGGSGGGGTPLPKSSNDSNDELQTSSTPEEILTEDFEVGEDGTVGSEIALADDLEEPGMIAIISEGTEVTDNEGEAYNGSVAAPRVSNAEVGELIGLEAVTEIYEVGLEEGDLNFSKDVELRFTLSEDLDSDDDLSAYFFDKDKEEWALAEDGGELMLDEDGDLILVLEIDHFTKFVVMRALEEEDEEEDLEEEKIEMPFVDVDGHWAMDFVADLYDRGIVSGKDDTHYEPEGRVTRAEVVKIAVNMVGLTEMKDGESPAYSDVAEDDWHYDLVMIASSHGFVSGYADGSFKPDQFVTRAEALRILFDAAHIDVEAGVSYEGDFADVAANDWFVSYVDFAAASGIVSGYGDGNFGPNNNLTRGEIAKIVSIVMEKGLHQPGGAVGMVLDVLEEIEE